jgi:hypothetical protein
VPRRFLVDLIPNINVIFEKIIFYVFFLIRIQQIKVHDDKKGQLESFSKNFNCVKILTLRGNF